MGNADLAARPLRACHRRYGIVGGLGAIAGADVLQKMVRATQLRAASHGIEIAFDQRHLDDVEVSEQIQYDLARRRFYIYGALKDMEARGIDIALVPCFISHTFLHEITPEVQLTMVNVFDALADWLGRNATAATIGVLASTYVAQSGVIERALGGGAGLVYPGPACQSGKVMRAVYGPEGIRTGHHDGECLALLVDACLELVGKGAQVIVPAMTEIPVVMQALRAKVPVPIVDSNQVYADYALDAGCVRRNKPFKLGVVGGVGPAATVDFMQKVVSLTDAARDQDHIKIVVEQNPQIPDRTANLVGSGEDPTIALLATCNRLEAGGADAVAIPCNTAHAYVDRIQPYLGVPIVNMLSEVVTYIRDRLSGVTRVGLLATTGTVASRVYHQAVEPAGMTLLVPEAAIQERVMQAIYGESGVKAGVTTGECSEHLGVAIRHLVDLGAEVIILGCTELPLVELDDAVRGATTLIDPTRILAARCVSLAAAAAGPGGDGRNS